MKREKVTNIIAICSLVLFTGSSMSLLAPFYPTVALDRGVTVSQSGWVFGSAFITFVIVTPLCGKYLSRGGGATTFLFLGCFICGIGNIMFGFLNYVLNKTAFLSLSILLRILLACGEAAMSASVYPLASQQASKDDQGLVVSLVEVSFNVGAMGGRVMGGFLYQISGFSLPFFTTGVLILVCTLMSFLLLDRSNLHSTEKDKGPNVTWLQIFSIPTIQVCFLSLLCWGLGSMWYSSSLAPFLSKTYGASAGDTGLVFAMFSLTNIVFTPVVGWLLDKGMGGLSAMALGNVIMAASFGFIWITQTLKWEKPNLRLTAAGIALHGTGSAASYVGSLVLMTRSTSSLPQTDQAQGMVSSVWVVAEFLGAYLGSVAGADLFDKVGFGESMLVGGMVLAVAVVATAGFGLWEWRGSNSGKHLEKDSHVAGDLLEHLLSDSDS